MGTAKHIGRIGALAVAALGIGNVRRTAKRLTVSIATAVLVVTATALLGPPPTVSPAVKLSADSTVLLVCADSCPAWHESDVEIIMNQFITPTHPSQPGDTVTPVAVTTPSEFWPITGLARLLGVAFGDPRIFGPGGSAWPDEPWWKLSGLFDLTSDQSELAGVADLEAAMAKYGNDHLVIYGESAGANTVNKEKRKLAAQYPSEPDAPDIEFVLMGDPNVPNGGLFARFPGLYIPILDLSLDGPEPTNTPFHTDVINRQYDGAADFPLYPLNIVSDLNALLGFLYLHLNPFDVSLPADPTTSPAYQGTYGDSSYYLFPTQDLPLFAPLRQLGVPEPLIDVVEPFFRVLVELGYDRSIPAGEPTPARLIPTLDPAKVTADLVNAVGEGFNNALALIGLPPLLSIPAPVTRAAPAIETAKADISAQVTSTDMPTQTEQGMSTGAATGTRKMSTDTATSTGTATSTEEVTETDKSNEASAAASAPEPSASASTSGAAKPTRRPATLRLTSTENVTEINTNEASTGPSAVNGPEPSASASTPKPAKPGGQPAKPRPVVRDSLGVGQQLPDRSHRGEGDQPTTRTAPAAGAATGTRSSTASSSAASSSTGSSSRGASGGDGHGS
jgi:hypothetical protein